MVNAARKTCLIIEDDAGMRDTLSDMLSDTFRVVQAATGEEGLRLAKAERPSVILMDIVMPEKDGFVTCQALRGLVETQSTPIIMISAHNDEQHRTKAFNDGADDFVAKPFTRGELVARVSAKVDRLGRLESMRKTLSFGDLILDLEKLQVFVGTEQFPVSVLEFKLLRFFVENAEKVLSRQQILAGVWKDAVVTDRTVDTHIACLRKKIKDFDNRLTTIYGAGYMLKR